MSQENVEIVRRAYDAFARGDLEGVLEIMDPDRKTVSFRDYDTKAQALEAAGLPA